MNLSGIWNSLPGLVGSQQAAKPAPAVSNPANTASPASVPSAGKTDQADLSSSGLAAAQSASSDVRMEKVQSVRSAIDAGTYQVSAENVADKMIQNLLG